MSTTVIDRLVVELGLDPRMFKAGAKEADTLTKKTSQDVAKGANEMVSSLRRVAVEFGALFLAVRSFRDVVGYMTQLQDSTRQLGVDARNTGEQAATLKDLGNAVEVVGGKAEDATQTVLGLQKAIFNAQHGLGWSDQLTEFARIGVDTGVNRGEMRPAMDIMRELAKSLEERYPDRAQRYQETQVLGLQGGMAQLVANGVKEFDRLMAEQRSIPQVTQGQTASAQRLHESYDVMTQRIEAIMRQVLTAVEPALEKLFKGIGDFLQKHTGDISKGISDLLGWFSGDGPQHVVDGLVAIGDAAAKVAGFITGKGRPEKGGLMEKVFGDKPFFSGGLTDAEKKSGLPIGTLDQLKLTSRDNTATPEDTAAELAAWHQSFGGDKGDPGYSKSGEAFRSQHGMEAMPKGWWQKQLDEYNSVAHPNSDAAKALQGADSTPGARAVIDGAKPTADTGARGGGVHLSVDSMNVYTQATDAEGIAGSIVGGLDRKLTVTYADTALA